MIGKGVVLECLEDEAVTSVRVVGRSSIGLAHPKLAEVMHDDFLDWSAAEPQLTDLDACFWCLGVSAAGMNEEDYRRVTHDYTLAAAETLLRLNPELTMCFVSGAGTDSSGQSKTMWARVKGETENALLRMPFARATMFRPALVRPKKGVTSKTAAYRIAYVVLWPLLPLVQLLFLRHVTTTEVVGRAMIRAARHGAPKQVLECADINLLGAGETS